MDLETLKGIWQEENRKLETRLVLNEAHLRKLNLNKTISDVDKLVSNSLLGRHLTLVYVLITFSNVWHSNEVFLFTFPAMIGGIAMLASFISHLRIVRPEYDKVSVLELQKLVGAFRVHTAAHARYDVLVITLWILTLVPLVVKRHFNIDVYGDVLPMSMYVMFVILWISILLIQVRKIYRDYDEKLKLYEGQLEKIAEFEQPA